MVVVRGGGGGLNNANTSFRQGVYETSWLRGGSTKIRLPLGGAGLKDE